MICARGMRADADRQGGAGAGRGGAGRGGRLSEDFPALGGLAPGTRVAGYRLAEPLGAGGMAVVYRALDERLGRAVALKLLTPALAADQEFRRRFTAESRAAAAVDHPHIIPVYEAGQADRALFIAMRLVTGGDLRQVLAREGPLPSERAAQFLSPVASALDAAHRAGLVHRDIKPANILVDAQPDRPDHVYLSDFGISKGSASSARLTGTGQYLGTPEYTSPEQAGGQTVDGRADQYALACVAWHLLTGTVPFQRDQGHAVLLAHLTEPPPPLADRRPDLPAAAGRALARAMAKEPGERYASCGEFAEALREALALPPYRPAAPEPGAFAAVTDTPTEDLVASVPDSETRTLAERRAWENAPAERAARTPTEAVPLRVLTEVDKPGPALPAALAADQGGLMPQHAGDTGLAPEIVRYGPGVPAVLAAGRADLTAAHVWRSTRPAGPSRRLARLSGWALTVILLAASGVLLYLRFHHAPFQVTHVAITHQSANGCGVDVTGRITTNGSAGTISYQWLFRPGPQPARPLRQSVVAGQRAAYVTVAVEGHGQDSASQTVTLQVLSPDRGAASAAVEVRCP